MSPAVHVLVVGRRPLPVGERGNDGACATLVQLLSQPAGIECLVGDEGIEVNVVDQRLDAHHVVALAREQHEADQTPQCVDQGDDLGGQSAP